MNKDPLLFKDAVSSIEVDKTQMEINLQPCHSENTLDKLSEQHSGSFLCVLNSGSYIVGELEWEQGHAPNYFIKQEDYKYYADDIKLIGILPEQEV